jgi:hypothetical protein
VYTLVSQPDCSDVLSVAVTPKKQKEVEAVPAAVEQSSPSDYMREIQRRQYAERFKSLYPVDPWDAPQQETPRGGSVSPTWIADDEGSDDDGKALLSHVSDSELFEWFE